MTQETDAIRAVSYAASAADVPRPACSRCEDWTTVVYKGNIIGPCPACRQDEHEQWLARRSGETR